jgi:hypothetical protein
MPRASLKDRIEKRNSKLKVERYSTKYAWYLVQMVEQGKITANSTAEFSLDSILAKHFKDKSPLIVPLFKEIYLLSNDEPLSTDSHPLFWVKDVPYYNYAAIVCLLEPEKLQNIQPIPFTAALTAIECLQFNERKMPTIEITANL